MIGFEFTFDIASAKIQLRDFPLPFIAVENLHVCLSLSLSVPLLRYLCRLLLFLLLQLFLAACFVRLNHGPGYRHRYDGGRGSKRYLLRLHLEKVKNSSFQEWDCRHRSGRLLTRAQSARS
jgi:hypothetical protein